MREDFCGTALVRTCWVESRKDRYATGGDIDPEVLQWGIDNNMAHLDETGNRLTLEQRDVRQVTRRKYDLINDMNFSYWIFSTRKEMLRYFRTVRRSLVSDGIFFLRSEERRVGVEWSTEWSGDHRTN